ncbi:energy transducer TonB [Mucilaginibacter sp.]|uniref:energy transducer TonB n=1 Tax=Mucilaginibacter sp. TaxID=1882438 RepID=UPI002607ADD9|nr:energy transducer TonB [Mucilaginibacter sp.]MDB4924330.1 TonB family protein [Mucilaginibacter sp.]
MLGSKLDILKQEWIDVVFSGRNKAYGAYDLRKSSPRNTNRALVFGALFFIFVISLPTIINKIEGFIPKSIPKVKITDVVLTPPPVDKKLPPPPPPEPPKPKTDQVKFPPPIVKPDNEVKEEPPTVKELKVADPGQKDQKGDPNADIRIDEPVGNSDTKAVTEDENKIFSQVEKQPDFPGGLEAFGRYLSKNIHYPAIDRENNVTGKVICQFVVERDGSLTDIKALRGPSQSTMDEAIRVLKASPKWRPGIQNNRPVRVMYTVPISFTLGSEN